MFRRISSKWARRVLWVSLFQVIANAGAEMALFCLAYNYTSIAFADTELYVYQTILVDLCLVSLAYVVQFLLFLDAVGFNYFTQAIGYLSKSYTAYFRRRFPHFDGHRQFYP